MRVLKENPSKKNEAEAEIMAKAGQVVYEVESFT